MLDYLLRFDSEAAALAAVPDLRIAPEDGERWADTVLPVVLVAAEAVYSVDEDAPPILVSPRETLPGFFLLTGEPDQPGQIATIERESGLIVEGDTSLAGARLDPVWAGAEPVLSDG